MFHLIFDTETTGLPNNFRAPLTDTNNWPRLVSISWIFGDYKNKKSFDFIIKPNGFSIPFNAQKIHGIDTEKALEEGYDIDFVLNIFKIFLDKTDIIVAHNLDFDYSIIGSEYYRIGMGDSFSSVWNKKKQFCTMKKSTELLNIRGTHGGDNKWPKLSELYQYFFHKNFDNAHNSLSDATACAECYFKLINIK